MGADSPSVQRAVRVLIPAPCGACQDARVACRRRGVWIQHPTWQVTGAWNGGPRVGGPEIQEARDDRWRASASNGAEALAALSGSRCDRSVPGNWTQREAKATARDTNRRNAGAGRQPWHREVRGAARLSGRPARVSWAGQPAPGCRVRHPRYPSHPRPHRRGRTARADWRYCHHVRNDITPLRPPPVRCRPCR